MRSTPASRLLQPSFLTFFGRRARSALFIRRRIVSLARMNSPLSRRDFFLRSAGLLACTQLGWAASAPAAEPIIDIHQHTNYGGRRDALWKQIGLARTHEQFGEQKFGVECDSAAMQKLYKLAEAYHVPILMHWQAGSYNYGLERFHVMLAKYPKVNFIGHAQTWWANIDQANVDNPKALYPKGK